MKNYIHNTALYIIAFIGLSIPCHAQQSVNCDANEPLMQKMCYQKVVSNLGEFIQYPEKAFFNDKEGNVVVRFTTDANKKIRNIQIIKASDQSLAQEVKEAVHLMALEQNLTYFSANKIYRIPIKFNLEDN